MVDSNRPHFYFSEESTPDKLVERFSKCTLENLDVSSHEIMSVLQKVAVKEDYEAFKKVIDGYFLYINRCFNERKLARGNFLSLKDIGVGAVVVDIENNYIDFAGFLEEEYFLDKSSYGPTMSAFAGYIGANGKDLVALVFEENYGNA